MAKSLLKKQAVEGTLEFLARQQLGKKVYVFERKRKIAAFFVFQTDVYNLFVTEFYKRVAINLRTNKNYIICFLINLPAM